METPVHVFTLGHDFFAGEYLACSVLSLEAFSQACACEVGPHSVSQAPLPLLGNMDYPFPC